MKKPTLAATQAHRELMRFAENLLSRAKRDARDGSMAGAQTQLDAAQYLLDLTPSLYRTVMLRAGLIHEEPPIDWSDWRGRLDMAIDFVELYTPADPVDFKIRVVLERLKLVTDWFKQPALPNLTTLQYATCTERMRARKLPEPHVAEIDEARLRLELRSVLGDSEAVIELAGEEVPK